MGSGQTTRFTRRPDREGMVITRSPLQQLSAAEVNVREATDRLGFPYIVYRNGDGYHEVRTLDRERLVIGRGEDADISVPWDRAVSRRHAALEYTADAGWYVVDDGMSTNGTLVNGIKIRGRKHLADTDLLQVGETAIAYCDPSSRTMTMTAPYQTTPIQY